MKRTVKDGWHMIANNYVYVEDNKVKRGITPDGERPTFPYRTGKYEGWDLDQYMTPDTFRRKIKNGSAKMF